jgi:hypothetical protein
MTDYTSMPLGPLAPNRQGEITECPHCRRRGLKLEDYKDPMSGSTEKEFIYIHREGSRLIRREENGRLVEIVQTLADACPIKIKPKSLEETPPA